MNMQEKVSELTDRMKEAARTWANRKIDELAADRPQLKVASSYLKRGLYNWMEREDGRIRSMVDGLMLFVADKDGNINADVLLDDAAAMFADMEVRHADIAGFGLDYGQGAVVLNIPRNAIYDLIFGDLGQVKITTADFLEIKEMIVR